MYDYKLLEAYAAVIENGGFEKAAQKLFITQSAVSQRVRLLEEQCSSILLSRTSPPVPTDTGRSLIAHYNKVRLLENDLAAETGGMEGIGFSSLCIGLNADTLGTWFFDAVAEAAIREHILLDLRVDDQDETHRLLKDGLAAGCISTRSKPMQGCSAHYLGSTVYRMYAAPRMMRKFFPDGFTTDALKNVPVIVYNPKDTLHKQMFIKAFGTDDVECHIHHIPSVEKYLDAVMMGMGIGMMPHQQCDELFSHGRLADAAAPHTVEVDLYWHRWNIRSKPLDVISDALTKFQWK